MKKNILKIFTIVLLFGFTFTLSSCDFHFEKLFESSNDKEKTDSNDSDKDKANTGSTEDENVNTGNTEENKDDSTDKTDNSEEEKTEDDVVQPISDKIQEIIEEIEEEIVVSDPTDNEKTNIDELKIKDYLLDYTKDYGYINLLNDENGYDMQKIYVEAYNLAKDVLTSANDYETTTLNVTVTNPDGTKTTEKQEYVVLPAIKFNTSDYSSSMNANIAASAVMEMIYDNPLFYFLDTGYLTPKSGDSIQLTLVKEYRTADARSAINNKILAMLDDFESNNDFTDSTNYDKYEAINKYIMNKIEYAYESDGVTPADDYWAHNIEGLVNSTYSKGVCECYAKSFKLIADQLELETIMATGMAQSNDGSSGGHAWNFVKLDEKWYGMDVTWNDGSVGEFNKNGKYFLKGKSFLSDHASYNSSVYGISYRVDSPTLAEHSYNSILF